MTRFPVVLAFLVARSVVTSAGAQQDTIGGVGSSSIVGQLVSHDTREPVPRASVAVVGAAVATNTDSAGRFTLKQLPAGALLLEIRAVGYAPESVRVSLEPRQVFTHVFEIHLLPYPLSEVVVKAALPLAERRFVDFERRRHSGTGYFVTQEQIERSGAATLVDILARARGVKQVCTSNDCVAQMVRAPPGCYPLYFLDGHESTAYFARYTPARDIRGIEIYRGSSEIPGEFAGSNSACGVIVIWTKSSP